MMNRCQLNLRITPSLDALIRKAATAEGKSVSAWVRDALRKQAERKRK